MLTARLKAEKILMAPGVHNALSALIAEQAGAEAVYLSGASIAYTRFARPDIGLVTMTEVAETLALICDRVTVPVIVDADNGYGNALNVQRCVRTFERAGAAAIQLEDQALPKRCGHLDGKRLIEAQEMAGKIRAALDARTDEKTAMIARTDAIAVEGFEAALDRASLYAEAGADILFVEAPRDTDQMRRIIERLGGRCPLLANMVEGGKTPMLTASELEAIGYSMVIFPGGLVRAEVRQTQAYFASLLANGTTAPFASQMTNLAGINQIIGTADMLALSDRYAVKDQKND